MKKIGILTHKQCDLDALCSVMTMTEIIEEHYKNIEPVLITEDSYLKEKMKNIRKFISIEKAKEIKFDYLLVCDVNEYDRVYGIDILKSVPIENRYLIDHHDDNRIELEIPKQNQLINKNASSTCEIIAKKMIDENIFISNDIAYNLYLGILSDTSFFSNGTTEETMRVVSKLPLADKERLKAHKSLLELTPKQEYLLSKIEEEKVNIEGLAIYKLLLPIESGDITPLVKHNKFQEKVVPTEEKPVSCFIIGIGNNYFIKFKKLADSDIDILSIAKKCNGGGHKTRCAGRFYNDTYTNVFTTIINEYEKNKIKTKKYKL